MAKNDNVVIIGSLNDQELKNSIDALVKHVEAGTQKMATNFDNTIEGMKKKLQSLGNISIDVGGASDGGSSRRTKKIQDEAQGVRNLTISYDQLAIATQRAMQPKSAQDSFYTFLQSYREHASALARELKQMPSASLDRQFTEYQRFESEIMRVQERIRELRSQLNEVGKNPNASRFEVKAITDEIGLLENKIRQLTSEQIANTRRIANEDNMALSQKKALYDNTLQIIREMTTVEKQGTTSILSQVDAQEQLNRKVQRQAEIIRQRMAESGNQFATWGSAVIYDPSIKKDHASIEEQLTKAHQDQLRITQERIAAEQREKQTKQETLAVTQQQAQAEQQVTSAQQQRSGVKSTPKTFQNYEDFRAALAHVLGLQQQEIKLADEETASYNKLSATLKTLQSAYFQLSASERNSDNGRTLVASMHEVERAMQQIRAQAAKPVNLQSTLGLSEKSLDDIAYKLRMLQSYRSGLDLTKQADEVKRTTQEIDRLQKKQNEVIGTTRRWAKENDAVSRSFDYIKNRLAFMFTIGAATNFVKQIYEIRGQYELLERSIGILVDSLQQGSQIFAELNAMAIKSPFTTMELGAAAKQLTAYDIAAKDVVDTTKRLADMAAAVGVPIERLTYALGQIKAYGYLNARDARMFANAGIPLVQELADRYTELEGRIVSVGDVYDRIKKKAISFEDVLDVINNVTDEGGRFFNFQEKAADTLKVKLANLTLAWNNMMNEIGKSNQSLLTMPLSALKTLFEHWRDLNNIIRSVAVSFGVVKLAQIAYYVWMRNATLAAAAHVAVGAKLVTTLTSLKAAFVGFVTNPFATAIAGLTLMGVLLAKAVFDYRDLQQANEDFNRSIANNADENIKSIDKFFDEYKKQLDGIGGENAAAQQKMWERLREEIEKASKSAQTYLQILDNIGDVSKRISAGREVLEQIQEINKEAKSLAERGLFDVGGGFANDSLAKDLKEYDESFNKLIKDYGSLKDAAKDAASETASAGEGISFHSWWNYLDVLKEAERELGNFSSVLDKANLSKIMGDGTPETQIANIREFTSIIRDNFLATEQGQKVSANGRALLNHQLDEWIAKQGIANGLINSERATIEANRTAWETFFDQLNKKDKERIDYMVETNQTGSEDFRKIWDKATKAMSENANASYLQIQDQIANLRNTPDIVINVVYRETKEKLDAQQEQYQKDFLTPAGEGVLSPDKYFEERKKLVEKYGRFQKKEGENNVEWEKRLGEEYRNNNENIKKLNAQLVNSANLSEVDREAKEKELQTLKDQNKVLSEIKDKQNFDYSKKTKGGNRKPEDVVAEALKQELQLIREMQSNYDKLRKSGVSNMDAIDLASKGYEATIIRINQVLSKFGIDKFNAANFAGKDVRSLLQSLEQQRKALLASGKVKTSSLQALDVEIQKLTVDAKTYDMKKVTDGLNSELGKIKDEYELAIELDANPELGGIFADMMGIDEEQLKTLPRTFNQVVAQLQASIDKLFADNNIDGSFDLTQMLDKGDFDKWVTERGNTLDDSFVKALNKIREYANKVRLDEAKETTKNWSQLIDKYGQLQYRLVKIAKDATKEMKNIVNKFGNDEQKQLALDLANKISISQDPSEIARLQEQLRQLLNQVTQGNEQAVNINAAVQNQQNQQTSKAYWEDFKNSDYYTMMFEDMSRNSTRAIQLIIDKMNELKDKVKEDPASMKALSKSLQDAQKELESRSSTVTILDALKEMRTAYDEVTTARKNLANADKEVGDAEKALESSKGDADKTAAAVERLRIARERQKQATLDAANAETKYRAASKKLQGGMETLSSELQNVQSIFGAVAKLFAAAGDDETAEAINAISEGFSIMTTIIMGVVAAMVLLESTQPWLLAVAAALSVIVGLVSWLSGSNDKEITNEVKKSELTVKRLENSYKNLEKAVEEAFGASEIAARKAEIANKKLQLAELQRQLQLERSRDGKKRDAGKIADLEGQIIDLKNEIKDMKNDVTNSFLGISSVKDAVGSMMDDIVDALRNGEDAMGSFNDSIDDMIANMIKQVFSARILGPMLEKIWDRIDADIQKRGEQYADYYADYQATLDHIDTTTNNTGDGYYFWKDQSGSLRYSNRYLKWLTAMHNGAENLTYQQWHDILQGWADWAQEHLEDATTSTMADVRRFGTDLRQVAPELEGYMGELENILREMGLIKDATSEEALSKLQQGIQGVTEDTAGAIEAYMNIVAQRVFEQNLYLQEIRDHLNNFDLDVQLGTLSQMLLQLQQSYQVQQNIESILTGVLNPSGRAIVVELNS